jgi:hypothetical protein
MCWIEVPQLSGSWQHSYSAKTRQKGRTNEQSIHYQLSMALSVSQEHQFGKMLRWNWKFGKNIEEQIGQ